NRYIMTDWEYKKFLRESRQKRAKGIHSGTKKATALKPFFQLDKRKYTKTSKSYNRATTYFKVVGYNKFVKKYSVAVYVSGHFFDTRMMTGEQIKSFGVKYYSKLKIN